MMKSISQWASFGEVLAYGPLLDRVVIIRRLLIYLSSEIISRNSYWIINANMTMPLGWRVKVLQTMFDVSYSFTVNE